VGGLPRARAWPTFARVRVRLRVQNFAALRAVDFEIPAGVSAVVGPNGSGKSTLLNTLELFRHMYADGLLNALGHRYGGASEIRNYDATPDDAILLGLAVDDVTWHVEPRVSGAAVDPASREVLSIGDEVKLRREALANAAVYAGRRLGVGEQLAIRVAIEDALVDDAVVRWHSFVQRVSVYHSYTYRLYDLVRSGSQASPDLRLHVSGLNAFSVLRNWSTQRSHKARYGFVCNSLRRIYPDHFREFDFQLAGQTVTLQVVGQGREDRTVQIAQESTGFAMALLSLCAVASGQPGGLIAIDEIENSLHPAAIARLFACIEEYAAENDLRVLIATHSPVVLDQFRETPANVFVMQPGETSLPVALDRLFDDDWLKQFSLGRLYTGLEYGAPGSTS
jgi:predicted ATPase